MELFSEYEAAKTKFFQENGKLKQDLERIQMQLESEGDKSKTDISRLREVCQ